MKEGFPLYLVKFIKECYLNDLLHNGLYMNDAEYYARIKNKGNNQSDTQEGNAVALTCMYKNRNRPVWCCSGVFSEDIINGKVAFDKRIIADFFDGDLSYAYAVVFPFVSFIEKIYQNKDEYEMVYGMVTYEPYCLFDNLFMTQDWSDCIMRKGLKYNYQKEFRIAINRRCEEVFSEKECLGFKMDFLERRIAYQYHLPQLVEIAKLIKLNDVEQDEKRIYIAINQTDR